MKYPQTVIKIIDDSAVTTTIEQAITPPVLLCAFSSAKGEEKMKKYVPDDFLAMFGDTPNFSKYGQAQLQAYNAATAGASIVAYRVVAEDATLANLNIDAKVRSIQKTDDEGNLLYLLDDVETTDDSGEAIMIAEIKYEATSLASATTLTDVVTNGDAQYSDTADDDGYKTFPLFSIADIGRGASNKSIRIYPDYTQSKKYDFTVYYIDIIEGSDTLESIRFSVDDTAIISSTNISFKTAVNSNSLQIKVAQSSYFEDFIDEVASLSGLDADDLITYDLFTASNKKGTALDEVVVSDDTLILASTYGTSLANGDNGSFGSTPIDTTEYETQITNFFAGTTTDDIYDIDRFKIDAVVDANYPAAAKRAIEDLIEERGDMFYFRDLGFITTMEEIEDLVVDVNPSKWSATYMNSYDVIDPYTKKQISVTIGYSIATLIVSHINAGRNRPFAGKINGLVMDDIIDDTINFIPKVTPSVNNRETLIDLRVNYISVYEDEYVLDTMCTSQEEETEFSYINNVMLTAMLVMKIRTKCPSIRYSFIDGDDLDTYQADVEEVISLLKDKFSTVTFTYLDDSEALEQKTYKAAIEVSFRDFASNEYFTITAV